MRKKRQIKRTKRRRTRRYKRGGENSTRCFRNHNNEDPITFENLTDPIISLNADGTENPNGDWCFNEQTIKDLINAEREPKHPMTRAKLSNGLIAKYRVQSSATARRPTPTITRGEEIRRLRETIENTNNRIDELHAQLRYTRNAHERQNMQNFIDNLIQNLMGYQTSLNLLELMAPDAMEMQRGGGG